MAWRDLFRMGRKSASTLDLIREIYGAYRESRSGKAVNLRTALQVSTVFGCARVIANGIAQVPLKLMRESPDGRTRLPAKDHPLYDIMGLKPNPWQTSFELRQTMSWHVELAGRFIAFKNAPAGVVREVIPFEPDMVEVIRNKDRTLTYKVRAESGSVQEFPEEAIWHVRGPSWNSWSAVDFLWAAREAIGLSIAIEDSQAGLHKRGVQTSGVYSVEGKLSATQYTELRDWIEKEHGADHPGRPMILDRAAKWMQTQMTSVDAQMLESRREQIAEICRFFGVVPIMVGHTDKVATYASAEQMFLAHIVHCLSPRWEAYEQSMQLNLLSDRDRKDGLYFDFVERGMARGTMKDTKDYLLGLVNGGLMTPNEGREELELNPDDDTESDELRIPVNTTKPPEPSADPPTGA